MRAPFLLTSVICFANIMTSDAVENKGKNEKILLLFLASYLNIGAWRKVQPYFLEDRFYFVENVEGLISRVRFIAKITFNHKEFKRFLTFLMTKFEDSGSELS